MVNITHAIGILTQRLGSLLVNSHSAEQRDKTLQNALNSPQMNHLMDQQGDLVHEKMQSALENTQIMDKVHISPEAQKLFEGSSGKAPPGAEGAPE